MVWKALQASPGRTLGSAVRSGEGGAEGAAGAKVGAVVGMVLGVTAADGAGLPGSVAPAQALTTRANAMDATMIRLVLDMPLPACGQSRAGVVADRDGFAYQASPSTQTVRSRQRRDGRAQAMFQEQPRPTFPPVPPMR